MAFHSSQRLVGYRFAFRHTFQDVIVVDLVVTQFSSTNKCGKRLGA